MESFSKAFHTFLALKQEKSLALEDIVRDLHKCIMETAWDEEMKMFLIGRLAEIEFRLAAGASEKAQIASVVGAFIEVRSAALQ